jgi:hypothetical protein
VKNNMSVAQIKQIGVDDASLWVPRMSSQAILELGEVRTTLQHTDLQDVADVRKGPFCLPQGKFDLGGLYRLLKSKDGNPQLVAGFVWSSYAPRCIQFFIWLLMQRRIQCRTNLVTKQIVDTALCEVCGLHDKTADHIIAGCPFARTFWAKLDFNLPLDFSTFLDGLHCIRRPPSVTSKHFSTFIALCC